MGFPSSAIQVTSKGVLLPFVESVAIKKKQMHVNVSKQIKFKELQLTQYLVMMVLGIVVFHYRLLSDSMWYILLLVIYMGTFVFCFYYL